MNQTTKEFRPELIEKFRQYAVTDVTTIEDFLTRYYKPERYTGRGEGYAASLLACYQQEFEAHGWEFISRHDSVTGRPVALFKEEG